MKKITYIYVLLLFTSCFISSCCRDTSHFRYTTGDSVFLKPDSNKAIIVGVFEDRGNNKDYRVRVGNDKFTVQCFEVY